MVFPDIHNNLPGYALLATPLVDVLTLMRFRWWMFTPS
jgi:hypothetical protein